MRNGTPEYIPDHSAPAGAGGAGDPAPAGGTAATAGKALAVREPGGAIVPAGGAVTGGAPGDAAAGAAAGEPRGAHARNTGTAETTGTATEEDGMGSNEGKGKHGKAKRTAEAVPAADREEPRGKHARKHGGKGAHACAAVADPDLERDIAELEELERLYLEKKRAIAAKRLGLAPSAHDGGNRPTAAAERDAEGGEAPSPIAAPGGFSGAAEPVEAAGDSAAHGNQGADAPDAVQSIAQAANAAAGDAPTGTAGVEAAGEDASFSRGVDLDYGWDGYDGADGDAAGTGDPSDTAPMPPVPAIGEDDPEEDGGDAGSAEADWGEPTEFGYPSWCRMFDMKTPEMRAARAVEASGVEPGTELAAEIAGLAEMKARESAMVGDMYGINRTPMMHDYSGLETTGQIRAAVEQDIETAAAAGKAMVIMGANIGKDPYAGDPVVKEPHEEETYFGFDDLDIAEGYFKRLRGLMGRETIPEEYALLFPRCRAVHTHMMKVPIDVIYLDGNDRVLGVEAIGPRRKSSAPEGTESILECRVASVYERDIRIDDILDREWGKRPGDADVAADKAE